ncbi:DNA gyrase inhibitor YacG [Neisseria canis]|uniref:DNA gyrase inhibitor YacG n=1 Tax=Neisseria canis TaxID=493 RepID=A0A1X3CX31_9NEIS|nr:DNA gyrase inhibitor YacG [Neisseria canis]OSI12095.1 DNA gyrase inhibitor YacG [Neisseria canis]VEF00685.1 zinc-binding protein YacG [Neisseria canis]
MTEVLMVKCPTCGAEVAWVADNRYRPFCSERCKMIDLGAWANEDFKVEASEEEVFTGQLN